MNIGINGHTCIKDDGGTPNRKCDACEAESAAGVPAETPRHDFLKVVEDFIAAAEEYRIHSELLFSSSPISITQRMLETRNVLREQLAALGVPPTTRHEATMHARQDVQTPSVSGRQEMVQSLLKRAVVKLKMVASDVQLGQLEGLRSIVSDIERELALGVPPAAPPHNPPAVHHLCGPNKIGVTGPPHASWCYHDKTWVDGAAQQDDYTCSACGTKISTNISEWAVAPPAAKETPRV